MYWILLDRDSCEVAPMPGDDALVLVILSFSIGVSAGARNGFDLLVGPQPLDLVVQLAVLHLAVRRDEEAVFVDVGVDRTASEIRPMFVPSGVSIGQMRP